MRVRHPYDNATPHLHRSLCRVIIIIPFMEVSRSNSRNTMILNITKQWRMRNRQIGFRVEIVTTSFSCSPQFDFSRNDL